MRCYFGICLLGVLVESVHASGVYFSLPQSDDTEVISAREKLIKSESRRNFTQKDLDRIVDSIEQSEGDQQGPVQALVRAHPEIVLRATQLNNTRLLARLIKGGVSVNTTPEIGTITDNQGNGPLHVAVQQGNVEAFTLLLVGLNLDPTLHNNRGFDAYGEAALRQDDIGKVMFNVLSLHSLKKNRSPELGQRRASGVSLDKSL